MAMIHVSRSGATLGIFEEEKVREGLRTGQFIETDLGWMDGMPTWRPLSELESFRTPIPPPPSAAPITPQAVVPVATPTPDRMGLPWENRGGQNLFSALFETIGMIFTRPEHAFSVMKRDGGLTDPLLYVLILGSVFALIGFGFTTIFHSLGSLGGRHPGLGGLFGMGISSMFILLVPFVIIIAAFIGAAITHLCLMIVGGANHSFETTLRVLCYANGSAHVLQLVPICGGVLSGVAALILNCIGLARAHETDTWRAVVAILLPLIFCCGGGMLLFFAIFTGAMASNWH